MIWIFTNILLAASALLIMRIWPIWHSRKQGCDAYYFLLCSERFRNHRRLPIELPPYYLLEPQKQWYPPGFSVFLGLLPKKIVENYFWAINHILDLVPALAIMLLAYQPLGVAGIWIGTLIYGSYGGIASEYSGMTSRPLGNAVFTVFLLANHFWIQGSSVALPVAILSGVLLLYTHKLTVQLLWFVVPALAILNRDHLWLLPLLGSYLSALLIAPRLFIWIQRAHWDIVRFWYRNWKFLGAHPIRQSRLFGDGHTDTRYYQSGWVKQVATLLRILFHMNYWVLLVPFAIFGHTSLEPLEKFLLWWILFTYTWAILTAVVPALRCLGLGQQYIKYAAIPSVALPLLLMVDSESNYIVVAFIIALLLHVRYYLNTVKGLRESRRKQSGVASPELDTLCDHLASLDRARVFCLPYHLHDYVAYHSRCSVLWGTHGYGFEQIQPIFPLLETPLADIARTHNLTHILLDSDYATPHELDLTPITEVELQAGSYTLYALRPGTASTEERLSPSPS